MTYDQLLPVYQRMTGLPGQDDAFNHWVQDIINKSGSQQGVQGIPDNYFQQNGVDTTPPVSQGGTVNTPTLANNGFNEAPAPAAGGNYNQVQNAVQGGQFGTVGTSNQTQNQTTGQATTGNTASQLSQLVSGTNSQDTNQIQANNSTTATNDRTLGTSDSTTQGTTTQNALDSLGFGALLKGQADSVGASDASRNAWLQDVMQTGGSGFNSQVDQAVRNSLTGPQMTGAGDSARARAAGYAGAEIGRTNLGQRLEASNQLAGPTGLSTLSTAANPYIGSTSTTNNRAQGVTDNRTTGGSTTSGLSSLVGNTTGTNNQATTGTQNQQTSGNTTGFSNLVSNGSEAQAGSTSAQSSQAGAGQIPQGQPVKSGGCVLCTAAIELKLSNHRRVLRRVIRHKLQVDPRRFHSAARGYFAVFTPLAAFLLSHRKLARTLWPLAKFVVYEELRVSGRRLPFKVLPWVTHWVGHTFCAAVGATFPVKGYVDDIRILDIARRNNILFEVQS